MLNIIKTFSIALIFVNIWCTETAQFPKNFVRCRPTDDNCVLKRANEILHGHSNGYPEINLDKFDPLPLEDFKINGNADSPVNLNLEMFNLSLFGYSNTTYTKFGGFKDDPKETKLETESISPQIILKGKYKISGKLLFLPISGEGDVIVTISDLLVKSLLKTKIEVKDGKTFMKPDVYKLKFKPKHMHIQMTNLFNGDKVLSENILKVINENWKILWDELEPKMNQQITKANEKALKKFLESFSFEDIFI